MATTLWHTLPLVIPGDGEVVWVRVGYWAAPWLATWSSSAATFTHSSGLVIPWYAVWRWRHQVEP